jgi:hypothetical protein
VLFDVVGRGPEHPRVVLELTEATVAVEAEQSADGPRRMVVIHVRGRSCLADGTHSALGGQQEICFLS